MPSPENHPDSAGIPAAEFFKPPPIPKRRLANWLDAYMDYSQHSEAPDQLHFWTGVSVVAGALRRQVWIDQGYFQWVPNFYIIFVAPPGIVSKSTTANIGMSLLRQIDGINFGPDAVTWQALIQSMANAGEIVPLPGGQFTHMSAITIFSSEFGTFFNPRDREMVDALTALWDGQVGPFHKATKTQGSDVITNPWINILAATTPSWIAENFSEYMIGGGFTSRCILVYADRKRRLVPYPADELPADFKAKGSELVRDLETISMLRGEYTLSEETKEWGRAWYTRHWERPPEHLNSEVYGNYLARKQTHMHKLAMVLSAAEHDRLIIDAKHLKQADTVITGLEATMTRIFEGVGLTESAKFTTDVIEMVHRHGRISYNNCFRLLYRKMAYDEFRKGVDAAVMTGHVTNVMDGVNIILAKGTDL